MAEEIQEVVQIILVAYDGIEIVMKVGSGGISAMQKVVNVLKGGNLQVLTFKTEDIWTVEKLAKKYGKHIRDVLFRY